MLHVRALFDACDEEDRELLCKLVGSSCDFEQGQRYDIDSTRDSKGIRDGKKRSHCT